MRGAPSLPPAYRLVALDSVGSTNDEAKRVAREGAQDGTLVWARSQTGGRGRGGRAWASPEGNLYLSLVLRPACLALQAAELGFVAAVALGTALDEFTGLGGAIRYKWPNDVLIGDRKLTGILLETESAPGKEALDWLILGIGVNIAHFPQDTPYPATSLRAEGETGIAVETVLEGFAAHFLDWSGRWRREGFAPIRTAWLQRARGRGEGVTVRLPNATLRGTFVDLDADGALLLKVEGEGAPRRITAGDVFFG